MFYSIIAGLLLTNISYQNVKARKFTEKWPQPHIIIILADDLGWNDVGFHGSNQIPTPNIDALAYNGIILNNLYAQPVCTPSRASLLTGKHPIHLGMQGQPILAAESFGLPLSEKILPQYLKELNYTTKAVGKWHLGFYKNDYIPTKRGFDTFYGYYGGFISYYDHVLQESYDKLGHFNGYDFRLNNTVLWEAAGKYTTDLLTKEAVNIIKEHDQHCNPLFLYISHLAVHAGNDGKLLEAPQSHIKKFSHILDPNRRTYAAMVSKLDDSVGEVVEILQECDMLQRSIIVFMSDNGSPGTSLHTSKFPNWGSNLPLRGVKNTLWEGGVKVVGFVWSSLFLQNARVSNHLMHISDWLPTLYVAAGGDILNLPTDIYGVNHWHTLTLNTSSNARQSLLVNIDEKERNAAIRIGNWKLVIGVAVNETKNYRNYEGDVNLPEYRYNIKQIMESKAGKAVKEVADSLFMLEANAIDIKIRRAEATISCSPLSIQFNSQQPSLNCVQIPCLFHLKSDPCEQHNLVEEHVSISNHLYRVLKYYGGTLKSQFQRKVDYEANPSFYNNTWSSWIS